MKRYEKSDITIKNYNDILNNPKWPPNRDEIICVKHPHYINSFIGKPIKINEDSATLLLLDNKDYKCKKLDKGLFLLKPS